MSQKFLFCIFRTSTFGSEGTFGHLCTQIQGFVQQRQQTFRPGARTTSWQKRPSKAEAVLSQRTRIIEKTSVIYIWEGWMWANCTQRPLSLISARWTVTVDCNSHDLALCMNSYVQEWWFLNKSFFSDFRSKMNVFTKLSIGALTLCHLAFGFGLVFKVSWPSYLSRTPLIFFRWPPSTTLQGF